MSKNNTREFRFVGKKNADQVWEITQHGESYTTRHGQLGGAMQTFSDTPGDKGKSNTKGYVSALDNCKFNVEREIRKKEEHGYIEYVNGKPVKEQVASITFDKFLPKHFCGYKPQTSIEPVALEKIHKAGNARYTRKYDGMCHVAVHHTHGWEIYSRRMDLSTERFPLHIEALEALSHYGIGTIIVGEMVCFQNGKDADIARTIGRVCRSDSEKARKLIADKEVPEPTFIIFDVLFHNGKDLGKVSYDERSKLWKMVTPASKAQQLVASVDYFDVTPSSWEKTAKAKGWEGFVVTDGSSVPGDKFYSYDGDAKRPKGHHKLKPIYEDDVVIFAASAGSGKRLDGIGAVHVKQLHPETKKWFYCGKVGSGFTDESLAELEELCKENDIPILEKDKDAEKMDLDDDGIVCMIEYGERIPKTQKFKFPVFIRVRDDKRVKECVAQKLAPEEE